MTRTLRVGELFTDQEIEKALVIYRACKGIGFNARVVKDVVMPALSRINAKTGQENDARFLGYVLEHAIRQQV